MNVSPLQLAKQYRKSHNQMRNVDGIQPQEAFDELLKYLFLKECADEEGYQFPTYSPTILSNELVSSNKKLVKELRSKFSSYLNTTNSWSAKLWQSKSFNLSDAALLDVHSLFENINFCAIDIDTRSAALNEIILGDLRKGLGIFPTPDVVARMIVETVSPSYSSRIFDPACGTGTFLIEVVRCWKKLDSNEANRSVWGVDKNARMLLLSELNLGHNKHIKFRRELADSLYQTPSTLFKELKEGFDYIFTNPPFGISLDRNKHNLTLFETCKDQNNNIVKRQQSEVVFTEQCIKYLKPGGVLAIVLPRSVVTNLSLQNARLVLSELGYLEVVVNLPPETFCLSGTQTNTVVLILRRYKTNAEKSEPISVVCANIDNVGFDSTGRIRDGNQLEGLPTVLTNAMNGNITENYVSLLPETPKKLSITSLPDLLSGRMNILATKNKNFIAMKELVKLASNGKTPGRANYSNNGLFLVKVGNLTGHGINWEARDRNYVSGAEEFNRRDNIRLMLKQGDILLTSSAHSPIYIAKKVDIVGQIPEWIGGNSSFVGEVMMIRVNDEVDPIVLIAYLRLPSIRQQIQSMIRGQTAHLHPRDILELLVPKALIEPTEVFQKLASQIRTETQISTQSNELRFEQKRISAVAERLLLHHSIHDSGS